MTDVEKERLGCLPSTIIDASNFSLISWGGLSLGEIGFSLLFATSYEEVNAGFKANDVQFDYSDTHFVRVGSTRVRLIGVSHWLDNLIDHQDRIADTVQ